ncbi:ABC transporter permease [Haematobacter missouriensis]|uniref:Amino acid ABC transporter permease n=1 Tax=Haematobacter missouriensis TaxID=366616 RepID=A0A212AX47_9RHOB|nr:ABC transporter permease subunit [Haematobacter missouriensis]OWJ85996.1 amino acid ABC transporter permease [Haematobacter missouriensis]
MTCGEAFQLYGLRALGFGERRLPTGEIGLCEQVVLIGSGLLWNIYFAALALLIGFFLATGLALAKASPRRWLSKPADLFIFLFRGSPLFIQFFFAYELFMLLPKVGVDIPLGFTTLTVETRWLTRAWLGALVVLCLNTAAYSGQIFYGALMAVPKGDIEAADAYGFSSRQKFTRIVWPTMLRLAWPAYTNEAIFLLHATTLVFFSAFPAWQQSGDSLYYASYFVSRTFNPFVAYPLVGLYFIVLTLLVIGLFGLVNRRLNRHVPRAARRQLRFKPQYVR